MAVVVHASDFIFIYMLFILNLLLATIINTVIIIITIDIFHL